MVGGGGGWRVGWVQCVCTVCVCVGRGRTCLESGTARPVLCLLSDYVFKYFCQMGPDKDFNVMLAGGEIGP